MANMKIDLLNDLRVLIMSNAKMMGLALQKDLALNDLCVLYLQVLNQDKERENHTTLGALAGKKTTDILEIVDQYISDLSKLQESFPKISDKVRSVIEEAEGKKVKKLNVRLVQEEKFFSIVEMTSGARLMVTSLG